MDPSVFSLDLAVWDGVSVERAEKALLSEIDRIRKHPPGKHELERALAQVKAQYAYTLDGVARQGFVIGIFELVISFETMARLVEKLSQVTPEMVSSVAEKYLTEKNRTVCRTFGLRSAHDS